MPLENWRLLDIGPIDPLETQTIYDMIAQGITEGKSENTLIICWPAKPLVSLGYFQEIEEDIDTKFCQENNIVYTRRVIGGGGVYLDDGQMFYQVIGRADSPTTPKKIDDYYRKFLEAPVQTYRNLGIPAEFKPVNDIIANGKKISGNGAGDVGDARILTGNLIFDFNFDMMVKVLKVPDEKFRDKVAKSLRDRMSTIQLETGSIPDRMEVKEDLIRLYEETLDISLVKGNLTSWEKGRMAELRPKYLSDEWLHWRGGGRLTGARTVRISATTSVGTANYKAPGGLVRATIEKVDGKVNEIVLSGDFFMLPNEAISWLELKIIGASVEGEEIIQRIKQAYNEYKIESPGVTPEDIETAIRMAIGNE
ncbi:lipoate--protein ligase family protein [Candidatus Thorarchaeota archaeon]|nr:MAG: lipoate--protein ligase family protein [Candidatus Thorarchaeota archaeon]